MIFVSIPLCIIFCMLGGQINKLFRPIGITLSIIITYLLAHNHSVWLFLPILSLAFSLSLGYGENSKLMKWLKSEQNVRIVLGILNSIPIILIAVFRLNWLLLLLVPFIVAAECIRLGSWGKIGKYDILPVDIFRGLAISLACSLALI